MVFDGVKIKLAVSKSHCNVIWIFFKLVLIHHWHAKCIVKGKHYSSIYWPRRDPFPMQPVSSTYLFLIDRRVAYRTLRSCFVYIF